MSIEVAGGASLRKISTIVHHYSRSIILRVSILKGCVVSSVALLPLPDLSPPLFAG